MEYYSPLQRLLVYAWFVLVGLGVLAFFGFFDWLDKHRRT